jgi:hypothetical protein
VWDVPATTAKDTLEDILLLAELAEAIGGLGLETTGINLLPPERLTAVREKIVAGFAGPSSQLTPLQRFLKWSVSDYESRPISPFSDLTVPEWIDNRIKEGTLAGLREAMQISLGNPRLTATLGRRLADHALLVQGVNPEEARRTRGEADFLTTHALKLAPNDSEVKELRNQVVKLLPNAR